jgi:hypothetical protein
VAAGDAADVQAALARTGIGEVTVRPIAPGLEDVFVSLLKEKPVTVTRDP